MTDKKPFDSPGEESDPLDGLMEFQKRTALHAFQQLYKNDEPTRFLVADEVGLGKTLIATAVVRQAIAKKTENGARKPVRVLYICSNASIANQNLKKFAKAGNLQEFKPTDTRLTLLAVDGKQHVNDKIELRSMTPGTSLKFNAWSTGLARERAFLFHLLTTMPESLFRDHDDALSDILQGKAKDVHWKETYKTEFNLSETEAKTRINPLIREKFYELLRQEMNKKNELYENIHKALENPGNTEKRGTIIGRLRYLLALASLVALDVDLLILDEFQRFSDLLSKNNEGNEANELAKTIFNRDKAKILLLSATPYKMYSRHGESGGDHQRDFFRTLDFLHKETDKEKEKESDRLKELFADHLEGILKIGKDDVDQASRNKRREIEKRLLRVMCRTERASIDKKSMLIPRIKEAWPQTDDLLAARFISDVAAVVEAGNMVEYWKSIPFPLNFMLYYDLDNRLNKKNDKENNREEQEKEKEKERKLSSLLASSPSFFLDEKRLENYEWLEIPHPKMRAFINDMLGIGNNDLSDESRNKEPDRRFWQLLWIPPSLPYSKPHGLFEEQDGLTKTLVFSSWNAVPDTIAALCSYQAQTKMFALDEEEQKALLDSEFFEQKRATLFIRSEQDERKKQMNKLRVRAWGNGKSKKKSLPLLAWAYPCSTLTEAIDPFDMVRENNGEPLNREDLITRTREKCRELVDKYFKESDPDPAWYWAVPFLLDHKLLSDRKIKNPKDSIIKVCSQAIDWERRKSENETEYSVDTESDDANKRVKDQIENLRGVFDRSDFGSTPKPCGTTDSLAEMLCELALAGPGICTLRALRRIAPDGGQPVSMAAAKVAAGFHSLFSTPEAYALLKAWKNRETEDEAEAENTEYWRSTLCYGIDGNLQSVLDEYVHCLSGQHSGEIEKIAEDMHAALTVLPSQVHLRHFEYEDGKFEVKEKNVVLTGRYAQRLKDGKEDAGRQTDVQRAFNSPFRPFVLATTSIGQEGLDFHPWCHTVVHWNLPSNPVDLEQREGRVQRFKGHAVRKNIAKTFSLAGICEYARKHGIRDPWQALFELAVKCTENRENFDGMVPFWLFRKEETKEHAPIERRIYSLPLSRDEDRLERLLDDLVFYRMTFGQPRQEDLVNALRERRRASDDSNEWMNELDQWMISLNPAPSEEKIK